MKRKSIEAVILLVATLLAIFTPLTTSTSPTHPTSTAMHKTVDIFNGNFSPSDFTAGPNETFEVSFSICPAMDVPDTTIRFIVPDPLVKLIKGEREWTGEAKKGETLTIKLSFAANGEIEAYIRANVKGSSSGKKYRSSYYLHATTPEARFTKEKGGSTRPVSLEAEISAWSKPESTRAPANPQSPGTIRIKGRFVYVNEEGGYSPARYMLVWIRDEDLEWDDWVAYQWTDADGNFDITCDNDDGPLQDGRDPYAQLWAEGAWDWITTTSGGDTYFWNNPKCGDNVDDGFSYDYGTRVPVSGNEALQAGDAVYAEAQWVYDWMGWYRPTKVIIRWPIESWPHCHGDYIDLPSKSTAGWDHVTVHHEYGHSVMWTLYGNSWPDGFIGGSHYVWMEDVMPDAWTEGWAEFMECAVDNDPTNLGGPSINIESNDWYNWQDTGDMDGAYIEGEVASILWDIHDPQSAADKDYMNWGFDEIFTVLRYGDSGDDDNPNSILDFWYDWVDRWPDLDTSEGPISTIYWHYGIDRDYYGPWGAISIDSGATYTMSTSVTLTLSADDWGSGVTHMRFRNSLDDPWSSWFPYATTKSWTLSSGDGMKYVYVQFKDRKGWTSPVSYDTIILDTGKPKGSIVINSGNPAYTKSTSVTLYLQYLDNLSGVDKVRYSNDGVWDTEPWEAPAPTKAWALTSGDGKKAVYYQVSDKAGWLSDTYSDTIILDTVKPVGAIVINKGNPTYTKTKSVTLYLKYDDATSGVGKARYSDDGVWDAEPWETPTDTKAWTLTAGNGKKTVYYEIRDKAGWLSKTYNDTIILDNIPPITTITHPPGSSSVSLSATDATSGVSATYYRIDLGAWITYTSPFTLTGTDSHTINYYSEDKAGNSETPKSLTVHYLTVNTNPSGLDAPTGEGWYSEGENATASVSTVAGYTFQYWYLDGQSETPYSLDLTIEVAMDNNHTATAKFKGAPTVTLFTVKPNPFSPNGDNRKDNTTISATFNIAVNWKLEVRTLTAVVLRNWTGTGSSLSILWDGKADNGTIVSDGQYKIRLSGTDLSGTPLAVQSKNVKVDTTPPTVTDISVDPTSFNPSLGEETRINYALSEDCYVAIKIFDSTNVLKRTLLNSKLQTAGLHSTVWDGKDNTNNIVPAGAYTIKILVVDKAGNRASPYPITRTVTVLG